MTYYYYKSISHLSKDGDTSKPCRRPLLCEPIDMAPAFVLLLSD